MSGNILPLQLEPGALHIDHRLLDFLESNRNGILHLLRPDNPNPPAAADLASGLYTLKIAVEVILKVAEKEKLDAEGKKIQEEVDKIKAETKKIQAETEKIQAETEKIKAQKSIMGDPDRSPQSDEHAPLSDKALIELIEGIRNAVLHLLGSAQSPRPSAADLSLGLQTLKTAVDASWRLAEKGRIQAETELKLAEVERIRAETEKIKVEKK